MVNYIITRLLQLYKKRAKLRVILDEMHQNARDAAKNDANNFEIKEEEHTWIWSRL
jgi:hypothetical protein